MNRREYLALSGGFFITGCTLLDSKGGAEADPTAIPTPTNTPTETRSTPTDVRLVQEAFRAIDSEITLNVRSNGTTAVEEL